MSQVNTEKLSPQVKLALELSQRANQADVIPLTEMNLTDLQAASAAQGHFANISVDLLEFAAETEDEELLDTDANALIIELSDTHELLASCLEYIKLLKRAATAK